MYRYRVVGAKEDIPRADEIGILRSHQLVDDNLSHYQSGRNTICNPYDKHNLDCRKWVVVFTLENSCQ
jgi:hypothetical protein